MTPLPRPSRGALAAVAAALAAVTVAYLAPYGHPSALVHMDARFAETHPVPAGFIALEVPGYDGLHYYQIARSLPDVFTPAAWPALRADTQHGANAHQRLLLPLLAGTLSLGHDAWIPWITLALNLGALLGAAWLLLKSFSKAYLSAAALALGPAATVGLHFSLAEPLTILTITAALLRIRRHGMDWGGALLLMAAVLAREVNILLVGGMGLWMLWKRDWRGVAWLLVPAAAWTGLQALLAAIFGEIPFFLSAAKHAFPFTALADLLLGGQGYSARTASSMLLGLGFVLPALVLAGKAAWSDKGETDMTTALLGAFLLVMTAMPDFIWGSVTSIGRVITPVYPLFALFACERPGTATRAVNAALLAFGLLTAVGLALSVHPFHLAS